MIITNKISVHLDQRRETPIINAVQGDSARAVEIALLFAKEPWIVPEGVTAMIRYKNLRKFTGGAYDTMPDGTSAYSFNENTVTLHLPEQVFGVDGHVEVQVTLLQNGVELTVFSFKVRVQRSLSDDVMTEEDYENLTEHIRNEVDTAVKDLELTGAVWVTVTQDGVGLAVDKSFAEIFDAHGDGQSVFCSLPDGAVLPLAAIDEEGALFQGEINREYQRVQIMADGTINYKSGKYALLEEIPAGSAGIYVGTEEPTDPNVEVWIDTEGDVDSETDNGVDSEADNRAKETYRVIANFTTSEALSAIEITKDANGNPLALKDFLIYIKIPPVETSCDLMVGILCQRVEDRLPWYSGKSMGLSVGMDYELHGHFRQVLVDDDTAILFKQLHDVTYSNGQNSRDGGTYQNVSTYAGSSYPYAKNITGIGLTASIIPAGTSIIIWGIDA